MLDLQMVKWDAEVRVFGVVFGAFLLAGLIAAYRQSMIQNRYSYRNAALLAGIIMQTYLYIAVLLRLLFPSDSGFSAAHELVYGLYRSAQEFLLLAVIPFLFFFLTISVSNVSLNLHEGFSLRNLLGAITGICMILLSVGTLFLCDLLYEKVFFPLYLGGVQEIVAVEIAMTAFLALLVCYEECLMLGILLSGARAVWHKVPYDRDYIVILGCALRKDGTPTPLLRGRCDAALCFAAEQERKTGLQATFVPSGGQGEDECVSEAESMRQYLVQQGISEDRILPESQSTTTLENMRFSKQKIETVAGAYKAAFATTNYHVFRSGMYAEQVGLNAEGIAAETKWYFWPNAFCREMAAMYYARKAHQLRMTAGLLPVSVLLGWLCFVLQ